MKLCRLDFTRGEPVYLLPGRVESYGRNYHPPASVTAVEACGYDVGAGWHPARCGQPDPCPEHGHLRCRCGEPAAGGCSYAGSLGVCGAPVCPDHQTCAMHR